jgi:hypothetical protein
MNLQKLHTFTTYPEDLGMHDVKQYALITPSA